MSTMGYFSGGSAAVMPAAAAGGFGYGVAGIGITPQYILSVAMQPLATLNQQINSLLEVVQSTPTPDQGTLLQLQMDIQAYNNDTLLFSTCVKECATNSKAIIGNMNT